MSGRPARGRLLLFGALSGLLGSAAFPPLDVTGAAYVALIPLLWALDELAVWARGRSLTSFAGSAFGAGWMAGAAYFAVLVWWIVLLDAPALTIPWVRYPGTIAIAAFLGL